MPAKARAVILGDIMEKKDGGCHSNDGGVEQGRFISHVPRRGTSGAIADNAAVKDKRFPKARTVGAYYRRSSDLSASNEEAVTMDEKLTRT